MEMDTIESCSAQLECFEHNGMLLHSCCGLSVHAARNLCHSAKCTLIYAQCCLQRPLIYKDVRYCNIYSIIRLEDFQLKFFKREGGGESLIFIFLLGWVNCFTIFFNDGSLTFLESFCQPTPRNIY